MPAILRVQAREPERRLIAAMVPEWLMANTMLRSITGLPAMSLMTVSAVTFPLRDSESVQAGVPFWARSANNSQELYGTTTVSPTTPTLALEMMPADSTVPRWSQRTWPSAMSSAWVWFSCVMD